MRWLIKALYFQVGFCASSIANRIDHKDFTNIMYPITILIISVGLLIMTDD
jgi:hypothetical protein